MKTILTTLLLMVQASALAAEPEIPPFPSVEFQTSEGNFVVELDGRRAPISVKTRGLIAYRLYQSRAGRDRYAKTMRRLLDKYWDEKALLLTSDLGQIRAAAGAIAQKGRRGFLLVLPAGGPPIELGPGISCRPAVRPRARLRYVDLDVYSCS